MKNKNTSVRLPADQLDRLQRQAHEESLRRGRTLTFGALVREVLQRHLDGVGGQKQSVQVAVIR